MKVPPKRKGNAADFRGRGWHVQGLNESPSEKEGKSPFDDVRLRVCGASMKVPPKRKGNPARLGPRPKPERASMKVPPKRKGNLGRLNRQQRHGRCASMKVPPKRKGNASLITASAGATERLNESPSEKEGKWTFDILRASLIHASMKVPPKRKGNTMRNRPPAHHVFASMKVPPKRKGNILIILVVRAAAEPQ